MNATDFRDHRLSPWSNVRAATRLPVSHAAPKPEYRLPSNRADHCATRSAAPPGRNGNGRIRRAVSSAMAEARNRLIDEGAVIHHSRHAAVV